MGCGRSVDSTSPACVGTTNRSGKLQLYNPRQMEPCRQGIPAATISALLCAYCGSTRPGQSHRHRLAVTLRVCKPGKHERGQLRLPEQGFVGLDAWVVASSTCRTTRDDLFNQTSTTACHAIRGMALHATSCMAMHDWPPIVLVQRNFSQQRPMHMACRCLALLTWKCFVLPGVGATAVFLEPNSALMVDDLPTLG